MSAETYFFKILINKRAEFCYKVDNVLAKYSIIVRPITVFTLTAKELCNNFYHTY